MSSYFTTTFLEALTADPTLMDTATVKAVFFSIAPALYSSDEGGLSPYAGIDDIDTLASTLGWGPYLTQTASQTVTVNDTLFAGSYYAILDNLPPDPAFDLPESPEFPTTFIKAIAFVYEDGPEASLIDNIIFVSNTPLGGGELLTHNDAITARPDTRFNYPGNRWLFGWHVAADPLAPLEMTEGPITLLRGAPITYDPANAQHVWLYPQRINFCANPSFETNTDFWRHNGTLTQDADHPPFSGNYSGKLVGTAPLIIESNMFPMATLPGRDLGWTIQAKIKSDGEVKVGLISWEASFAQTVADWGPIKHPSQYYDWPAEDFGKPCERWHSGGVFINIRTHRYIGDVTTGMLRFECQGTYLHIDQVCVEPGFLPHNYEDWSYFDGHATQYGLPGDFTWYGEPDNSYSMWYNHRTAVIGRLFSWGLDNEDQGIDRIITDREVAKQGMVYDWVPAGTPVQEHLDVLYPYDPKTAIPPVTGDVLPYKTGPLDSLAVTDPWATQIVNLVGITDTVVFSGDLDKSMLSPLAITDEVTAVKAQDPEEIGITDSISTARTVTVIEPLGITEEVPDPELS